MEDLISIGFTKKTYGTKGELKVKIKENYLEDFLKSDILFLGIQGKEVPFFKEYFKVSGSPLLKLEEIDDRDAASGLTSKEIFLRRSDVLSEEEREFEVVEDMIYKFLEQKHVLFVQGSGFNYDRSDAFRIAFLPHTEVLNEAFDRFEDFLKENKR